MNKPTVTIIGAGLGGCFMALCLAKKGYQVTIYESRPDVRKNPYRSDRSFNITLYFRGIEAMREIDVWEEIKKYAINVEGNVPHHKKRNPSFDPFDKKGREVLYTIHRNSLNGALLDEIEKFSTIKVFFDTPCISLDRDKKTIILKKDDKEITEKADLIIGADGVHSIVREVLQKDRQVHHTKEYENWGYKEVHVPIEHAEMLKLRQNSTHTWPRKNSLLLAFPNPDKSFTLMFNLPLEGKESFATLTTKEAITEYIKKHFPDLIALLPEITQAILYKPTGNFVTIITDPWYYKNFLVLIGDAAHGVTPFYGQGTSSAFEDCLILTDLIETHLDNLEEAFSMYQTQRKENTDVLAFLSRENFLELRDKSRSPYFILKRKVNTLLHQLFPSLWLPPLYYLIAHDKLEYAKAYALYQRQEKRAKWLGIDLLIALGTVPFIMWRTINKSARG